MEEKLYIQFCARESEICWLLEFFTLCPRDEKIRTEVLLHDRVHVPGYTRVRVPGRPQQS
jgi:hypothetical protein